MKKTKQFITMFLAAILVMGLAAVPVSAAKLKGEVFNLINEETGYQIVVPGFIEQATYEIYDEDGEAYEYDVIVVEKPKKNANGTYQLFEVITDDKQAYTLESHPEGFNAGILETYQTKFSDGSAIFSPSYFNKEGLDVLEDDIFFFGFYVFDKNNEVVFDVYDLNFVFETPAEAVKEKAANPTSSKVVINGEQVAFDAYSIEGNNYFKLRDLAAAINGSQKQFEVTWDSENNAIELLSGKAYTKVGNELATTKNPTAKKAAPTKSKIYLDGAELELVAYKIDGNNYFKLRDIASALDFGVDWDAKLRTIAIDTSIGYTEEQK
ncbi:stalk domain-containing protein [Paenibacillus sp. IITD108]|uniref:stalk domain-containing protein n=1 Tax=Paenibacillus sp. IITD108 TaxID=3116649 RepID=UPI002F3F1805